MTKLRQTAALLGTAALAAACDERGPQDITGAVPAARIKFFNFGVNAPGVNFYANDAKVTAIASADTVESTLGTASGAAAAGGCYTGGPPGQCTGSRRLAAAADRGEPTRGPASGAAAAGGFYSGVTPGQYTLSGRIAAATDKNLAIANVPATVADGKAYSFYLSGIYNTTSKQVDAFLVEDTFSDRVAYDTVYVRFVNAISNAGPLVLYFRNPTTGAEGPVSGAVAYKGASTFVGFASPGATADLVVRNSGATATAFSRTGVSFAGGRIYTVTARGDITVTSATAANRPQLDNTANR